MNFTDRQLRIARIVTIIIISIAVILTGIVVLTSHAESTASAVSMSQPQVVQQPPSASQVASKLHCASFQDKFRTGGYPGVVDDGICWIGSQKYGVNTFVSKDGRDAWLKLAEPFGVNPKWETDTAVVYPSTDG